jgi:hypothetical protein
MTGASRAGVRVPEATPRAAYRGVQWYLALIWQSQHTGAAPYLSPAQIIPAVAPRCRRFEWSETKLQSLLTRHGRMYSAIYNLRCLLAGSMN